VYSHILDEGRIRNAQLFEKEFYSKNKPKPDEMAEENVVPEQSEDLAKLIKLLSNPETVAIIKTLLGKNER